MNEEKVTIESLIKGGLIGAALGAFLSKDKEEGAFIGGLLGAAISATIKANEEATKTNVPLFIEEDGKLYEIGADRTKRFVKDIQRSHRNWPQNFKLK